jgi:hypothetical protein
MLQIKSGEKIYFDSFNGMIKGVYLSITGDVISIRITSIKNKVWRKGEIITSSKLHIFPRKCYHKIGIFTYSVYPDYEFI